VNNAPPRSPDEQFEAILLQLTQSAEARASWSPYRALILMLVSCLRDIKLALRQLAAHLREAAPEAAAAPEAEPEAGDAAPLPHHPTQAARPREATEQSPARPGRPRPQAAPATAPEPEQIPLPLGDWAAKQTYAGARGCPAGTSFAAPHPVSRFHPAPCGPPKISTWATPALWHAHNVTISKYFPDSRSFIRLP